MNEASGSATSVARVLVLSTGHRPPTTDHSQFQLPVPDAPATADDGLVRRLATAAGLAALGELAGRRARVPAAGGPPFSAAHRVVDRVHGHAPDVRPAAEPAGASGLAQADIHMVG